MKKCIPWKFYLQPLLEIEKSFSCKNEMKSNKMHIFGQKGVDCTMFVCLINSANTFLRKLIQCFRVGHQNSQNRGRKKTAEPFKRGNWSLYCHQVTLDISHYFTWIKFVCNSVVPVYPCVPHRIWLDVRVPPKYSEYQIFGQKCAEYQILSKTPYLLNFPAHTKIYLPS